MPVRRLTSSPVPRDACYVRAEWRPNPSCLRDLVHSAYRNQKMGPPSSDNSANDGAQRPHLTSTSPFTDLQGSLHMLSLLVRLYIFAGISPATQCSRKNTWSLCYKRDPLWSKSKPSGNIDLLDPICIDIYCAHVRAAPSCVNPLTSAWTSDFLWPVERSNAIPLLKQNL